jgi:hypothetical protein
LWWPTPQQEDDWVKRENCAGGESQERALLVALAAAESPREYIAEFTRGNAYLRLPRPPGWQDAVGQLAWLFVEHAEDAEFPDIGLIRDGLYQALHAVALASISPTWDLDMRWNAAVDVVGRYFQEPAKIRLRLERGGAAALLGAVGKRAKGAVLDQWRNYSRDPEIPEDDHDFADLTTSETSSSPEKQNVFVMQIAALDANPGPCPRHISSGTCGPWAAGVRKVVQSLLREEAGIAPLRGQAGEITVEPDAGPTILSIKNALQHLVPGRDEKWVRGNLVPCARWWYYIAKAEVDDFDLDDHKAKLDALGIVPAFDSLDTSTAAGRTLLDSMTPIRYLILEPLRLHGPEDKQSGWNKDLFSEKGAAEIYLAEGSGTSDERKTVGGLEEPPPSRRLRYPDLAGLIDLYKSDVAAFLREKYGRMEGS